MSTPFNVRAWASQAGIQTTGGFSVVAECVTVDELERFAQIVISQYVASQGKKWQGLTDEELLTVMQSAKDFQGRIAMTWVNHENQTYVTDVGNRIARAIEAKLKEKNT